MTTSYRFTHYKSDNITGDWCVTATKQSAKGIMFACETSEVPWKSFPKASACESFPWIVQDNWIEAHILRSSKWSGIMITEKIILKYSKEEKQVFFLHFIVGLIGSICCDISKISLCQAKIGYGVLQAF